MTTGESDGYFVMSSNVIVHQQIRPAAIYVVGEKIGSISTPEEALKSGKPIHDYGHLTIMAGLVDTHVHINEPGRTEWEGFLSATAAACAGGVTTIVDMPLNSSPVTTSLQSLETKIDAMKDKLWVDVGLLGGIVPGNSKELAGMVSRGVLGFKCFMIQSGIDDFPCVNENDVKEALTELSKLEQPVVMMFHAESSGPIDCCEASIAALPPSLYSTFLKSRPKEAEDEAIKTVIELCSKHCQNKVPCHIVHLSSGSSVTQLRQAKKEGVNISCETTFHYLSLAAEEVPNGNTLFKCCPPIRELSNKELLWNGLGDVISCIVSDHSPSTLNLKRLESGDFMKAWGGIASLQLGLSIIWTEAEKRGWERAKLFELLSKNTAQLVQIGNQKGSIEVGKDADFVVWDPLSEFVVTQEQLFMKNKACPYVGMKLKGEVVATYLRGVKVYQHQPPTTNTTFLNNMPTGRWVKRDCNK